MSDMIPVYFANQRLSSTPAFVVARDSAREWVESRLAQWVNKCRAVQMLQSKPEMHRPAQSLIMGTNVIEKAADGNPYFVAMVQEWRGI